MEGTIVGGLTREVIVLLGVSAARQTARVLDVHNEIGKLHTNLHGIMSEIQDAHQANWTIFADSEASDRRLRILIDIAYEAESIIDRFKLEKDVRDSSMQDTNQTIKSQICCVKRILSKCQAWSGSSVCRLCRDVGVSNKVDKLNKKLKVFMARELPQLRQLNGATGQQAVGRHGGWDSIGPGNREPGTIGRVISNDCNDLMKRLFPGGQQAVLAIVGAPGVGKTTLARKMYHQQMQSSVERLWVHVRSGPGNNSLLAIWSGTEMVAENASTAELSRMIGQRSKKLLVVIDNVRGDTADWSNYFLLELRRGDISIVVTTPNSGVAKNIGVRMRSCSHLVGALDEDQGWLLLREAAQLKDQDDVGEIEDIGRRIVRKCSGIPVALQVVGFKLRSRARQKQWRKELRFFSMDKDRYIEVRRSIDAAYMELEYRLKRCFLYCSLYPEGSVIEQQHVVQQWIAEGFFAGSGEAGTEDEPADEQRPEEMARECYKELLQRNLLLPAVNKGGNGSSSTLPDGATMTALLRSYALFRSSKGENCVHARHVGLTSFKTWRLCVSDVNAIKDIPAKATEHVRNLRTLMVLGGTSSPHAVSPLSSDVDAICAKFTNLRVLDLRDTKVAALGRNLKKLFQLRYLNLSGTHITTLPPEVGNLVALQFLTVKGCKLLRSLPEEVGRLTSLRSLDISGTPVLEDVPFRLANLAQLNSFRGFLPVASSSSSGWTFQELSTLSQLASLQILNLGSITQPHEAARLMLHDKTQLKELELDCTAARRLSDGGDAAEITAELVGDVLESLRPHSNLDSLKLANFIGHNLPSWVSHTHLHELQRLTIDGRYQCWNWQQPPLGMMEYLKFLEITGPNTSVSEIGSELRGVPREGKVSFPSLEHLTVAGMVNLETWSGLVAGDMPLLRSFSLSQCRKLKSLPTWLENCTALTSLKVQGADELLEISNLHLPALKELQVGTCQKLERIQGLTRLEDLTITACSRFTTLQGVPLLRSLCLVEDEHQQEETTWLLNFMCRMMQLRLTRLEIVASEVLLDHCSTGLAPYGLDILKAAAKFVHARLHDGSSYFSYTRSSRRFWRSQRCKERALMYGVESTTAIVIRLIQGVVTSSLGCAGSNGILRAANPKMQEFAHSLLTVTLDTIDAIQMQADRTIAHSEATNTHLKALADIAYEAQSIIDRLKIETTGEQIGTSPFQVLNKRLNDLRTSSCEPVKVLKSIAATLEAGENGCPIGPSRKDYILMGNVTIDSDHIIRRLQSNTGGSDEALFAIVGAPGVGKTTLAQKIYHQMRRNFRSSFWVHVPSGAGKLAIWAGEKRLLDDSAAEKEKITEKLAGSSVLLVIDNLRDKAADGWKFTEQERQGFYDRGVRIVVTTTHRDVARKIGVNTTSCCHRVRALDEDDGWLLLRKEGAIENGDDGMQLEADMRECSGIPMALVVLASKHKTRRSQQAGGLLEDNAHDGRILINTEIRRSIDASYMELGSHLKRCFLCCSLYPEGSVIERRDIVQQWVAEGFVDDEEEARRCYTELLDRGFLVQAAGEGSVMPALLRSYAVDLSEGENYYVVGDPGQVGPKAWRLCVADANAVNKIPEDVRSLRTLMVIGDGTTPPQPPSQEPLIIMEDICNNFTSLRVLDLRDTQLTAIGSSLKEMLLLRYLNLSNTSITTLPPEVGHLVALQFLTVKGCQLLTSLPQEVGHLTSLRSLDISGTPALIDVRFGLANLEQLNCFQGFLPVASRRRRRRRGSSSSSGCTFAKLGTLSNLTTLQILNPGSITQAPEAARLMLQESLETTRSNGGLLDISPEVRRDIQTNGQVAFPRLEELLVARLESCETWSGLEAGDMPLLRSMRLSECPLVSTLPSCTALTSLEVQGTHQLQEIRNLPALKKLHVQNCSGLQRICDLVRLEDLKVAGCPSASAVGGIPSLRSLRLEVNQEAGELPQWLLEQQPPPFSLLRLEIVGGEELLDKCSTEDAEYGRFIQDAADHVYGELHDGSEFFSYTRNTRHFQRIHGRLLDGAQITPLDATRSSQRTLYTLYVAVLVAFQCFVFWIVRPQSSVDGILAASTAGNTTA